MTIGGDIDPRVLRGDTKLNQQVTGSSLFVLHATALIIVVVANVLEIATLQMAPQTYSQTLPSTA
jgi:hypothetical protein